MDTRIGTVIFDLGGVLIDWERRRLFEALIPDAGRLAFFLDEVCSLAWNLEQDRGRTWDAAVAEATARHPDFAPEIAAYRDRWDDMIGGALQGTVDLLEALDARGVPLYALTNFSRETFPRMRERFPFLARFRGILVSGDEGLVKPDPAIYRLMAARFGLEPATCLFIDDALANVRGAEALGFHGHHFREADLLRRELEGLGLLG